jgi:predicted transposase YdaD
LWEVPSEQLLTKPGLLPFAVLSQPQDAVNVLTEVARQIEEIEDKQIQSNLAATSAILAGLVLDKIVIKRLLKEEIMKESVMYQEIRSEAKAEGFAEGLQRGKQQGLQQEANLLIRQLNRRIGQIPQDLTRQVSNLPLEQLENLGEALLDFTTEADLVNWLNQCQ